MAKSSRIAVLVGYPESNPSDDKLYNSAVLFGKDGSRVRNYRKCHLWGDESKLFTPNKEDDPFTVFEFEGHQCGIIICYDVEFPEPARTLALRGCRYIFVPTALPPGSKDIPEVAVRARALENHAFVFYSNHAGPKFEGRSCCAAPDGTALKEFSPQDVGLLTVTADCADYQEEEEVNPYLKDRRPWQYRL